MLVRRLVDEVRAVVGFLLAPSERGLATGVNSAIENIRDGVAGLFAGKTSPTIDQLQCLGKFGAQYTYHIIAVTLSLFLYSSIMTGPTE
jgi:hypothetical protein